MEPSNTFWIFAFRTAIVFSAISCRPRGIYVFLCCFALFLRYLLYSLAFRPVHSFGSVFYMVFLILLPRWQSYPLICTSVQNLLAQSRYRAFPLFHQSSLVPLCRQSPLLSVTIVLPFLKFLRNMTVQYAALYVWLCSLCTMHLKSMLLHGSTLCFFLLLSDFQVI